MTHDWLYRNGADWMLLLRVQPRARQDAFAGTTGERLKVRITAPPADGRANEHLRRWLAETLGVPVARVLIERGSASRDKCIRIIGVADLPALLLPMIEVPDRRSTRTASRAE